MGPVGLHWLIRVWIRQRVSLQPRDYGVSFEWEASMQAAKMDNCVLGDRTDHAAGLLYQGAAHQTHGYFF
jgi:hypothetical protein